VINGTELGTPHLRGGSDRGIGSDCRVRIVHPLVTNVRHLSLQLPRHLRHDARILRLIEDVEELEGILLGIEKLPLLFFASKGRAWKAKAFVIPAFKGQSGG
jgi:hypothetical protein